MFVRRGWLALGLLCLGCHALAGLELQGDGEPGEPQRPFGHYEPALAAKPALTRSDLSLAAACLEAGDDEGASTHLGRYVAAHPEHALVRAQYAELLLRLHRCRDARREFERFIADAQELGDAMVRHIVHGHTRLMEVAEAEEDEGAAHLHRGLGLYWLARERVAVDDPAGQLPVEALLCRAAGELAEARRARPQEARVYWYLYAVWSQLGQRQVALRWLRRAADAAPFSALTAAEQRSLLLARRNAEDRTVR